MLILAGKTTYVPSIHFFLERMYTQHWFLSFWICRSFTNFQGRRGTLHSRLQPASERLASFRYLLQTSESTKKNHYERGTVSCMWRDSSMTAEGKSVYSHPAEFCFTETNACLTTHTSMTAELRQKGFWSPHWYGKARILRLKKKKSEKINKERLRLEKLNPLKISWKE